MMVITYHHHPAGSSFSESFTRLSILLNQELKGSKYLSGLAIIFFLCTNYVHLVLSIQFEQTLEPCIRQKAGIY